MGLAAACWAAASRDDVKSEKSKALHADSVVTVESSAVAKSDDPAAAQGFAAAAVELPQSLAAPQSVFAEQMSGATAVASGGGGGDCWSGWNCC